MARRAAKRSPIPILETKGNPRSDFIVVIVAGSVARGRVRTTAATMVESRKMAVLLHILGTLRFKDGKSSGRGKLSRVLLCRQKQNF